jgi:hypothetical protein
VWRIDRIEGKKPSKAIGKEEKLIDAKAAAQFDGNARLKEFEIAL